MKILIMILFVIPLTSFAQIPAQPTLYWTRIAVQTSARQGECNQETARLNPLQYGYQETPIADPIGYPFGHVAAWSCSGDKVAAAQDFLARVATMQADAAAYRAAHPIATGATP